MSIKTVDWYSKVFVQPLVALILDNRWLESLFTAWNFTATQSGPNFILLANEFIRRLAYLRYRSELRGGNEASVDQKERCGQEQSYIRVG